VFVTLEFAMLLEDISSEHQTSNLNANHTRTAPAVETRIIASVKMDTVVQRNGSVTTRVTVKSCQNAKARNAHVQGTRVSSNVIQQRTAREKIVKHT